MLSEPMRRRVLQVLAAGEQPAGAIVSSLRAVTPISQPAVSQHLRVLRAAQLVDGQYQCWNEVLRPSLSQNGVRVLGRTTELVEEFHAVSVERRITHPCVAAITQAARAELFAAEQKVKAFGGQLEGEVGILQPLLVV